MLIWYFGDNYPLVFDTGTRIILAFNRMRRGSNDLKFYCFIQIVFYVKYNCLKKSNRNIWCNIFSQYCHYCFRYSNLRNFTLLWIQLYKINKYLVYFFVISLSYKLTLKRIQIFSNNSVNTYLPTDNTSFRSSASKY